MKKILMFLLLWTACLPLLAQEDEGGTTPTGYTLQCVVTPLQAGTVSSTRTDCTPGKEYYVYASARTGFKFINWTDEEGTVLSTEYYFYYTMPERDVVLTAHFEYSPDTPADPAIPETVITYRLKTQAFPPLSATTSYDKAENKEPGKEYYIHASARTGFKFIDWKDEEGNVVSNEYYFYYTMPERDVTLTAYFEYSPDTPMNPSRNYFDPATKTLYIDDFKTGELYSVGREYLNSHNLSKEDIARLVVIGLVNSSDVSNTGYFATAEIDLSRATGIKEFDGIYNASTLTSLILPDCVESIYYYAFSGMESLTSLTIYAFEPPTVNSYITEYLNPDNVIVYVPASALGLYSNHEVWGKYTIMPITTSTQNVTVELPAGISAANYANCYIDLVNAQNGQKMSYLVNGAMSYTYYNILQNTLWNAYLRTADGTVLGEINEIEVKTEDVTATFGTLKGLFNLTATVQDADGKDLTREATVQWLTPDGTFIAQDNTLAGQPEGRQLRVHTSLTGYEYEPVDDVDLTVSAEATLVTITAKKRSQATVTFSVTDKDGQPVGPYSVMLTQTIGKATYSQTGGGAGASNTTIKAYAGFPATAKVVSEGYIAQTVNIEASELNADKTVSVKLTKVAGTELALHGKATLAALRGQTPISFEAIDQFNFVYNFFNYGVVNKTTGKTISEYGLSGSTITLFAPLEDETQIEVTASLPGSIVILGHTIEVDPAVGTAIVRNNKADVELALVQRGGIMATLNGYNGNAGLPVMLFDKDGNLVQQKTYQNNTVNFLNLRSGSYKLVTMMAPDQNNAVSNLSRLTDMGLTAGNDYAVSQVTITNGIIEPVVVSYIEPQPEQEPDFFNAATTFTVNKSECVIGNYITLNAQVRFNDEVVSQVSNVSVVFDLQPNNSYVANSCMLGSGLSMVSRQDDELTVPVGSATNIGRIRFCTIPTVAGTYTPSAFVKFTYNGKEYMKLIGSATFDAKSLDINVQAFTADGSITVRGMAPATSTVDIYDGTTPIGSTTALADGSWTKRVQLLGDQGDHYIHAEVSNIATAPGSRLVTETKTTTWDSEMILPLQVSFQFFNRWLNKTVYGIYDLTGCTVSAHSYMFYTTAEYTFTAELTANGPEHLSQVIINVWLENGNVLPLEATYDPALHKYVSTYTFSWGNLPVNLSVDWTLKGEQLIVIDHSYVATTPCTGKMTPIHDPSGYVYEAVGSNRLEGVTATVYYKEQYNDMYGDPQERVTVWDAEEYGQVNPQVTDAEGTYHWDVPQGLWQVKFEKQGYETTTSDWLPVPPPQMEINIPMTQLVQPTVKAVRAYNDQIELDFSLYMDTSTLTTDSIFVTVDGNIVAGTIELVDAETVSTDDPTTYASKIRFVPTNADALSANGTLAVIVSKHVKAYNGLEMGQTFQQTLNAVLRPTSIEVAGADEITTTLKKTVTITVLPAEAAAGKTLVITTASDDVAKPAVTEVTLNDKGQAQVAITAGMLGETILNWQLKEADLSTASTVKVIAPKKGDVKIDDKIDINDVHTTLGIISGNGATGWGADVNGDGRIDIADIQMILNLSVKEK